MIVSLAMKVDYLYEVAVVSDTDKQFCCEKCGEKGKEGDTFVLISEGVEFYDMMWVCKKCAVAHIKDVKKEMTKIQNTANKLLKQLNA